MKKLTLTAGAILAATPVLAHQTGEAHSHDSGLTIAAGAIVIVLAVAAGAVRRRRARSIA
ncbi:hypothetical protein [Chachezhania antarctica]|uniref:hypothetical protein n=1 Tax=Chachezhania antarctica TaxID=2340860 RepID=UPI000EAE2D20|nr:hypothetical protein [Chachezhania antarctica]|tara:strand:- start:1611 stop:1790 length:180 start_codon:yes stop_codon:yes gene_type:complete